jgi:ATP-dependent RNA helicase RhlE
MKFQELGLGEALLRAVSVQGYCSPTRIQAAAIPPILGGRDVLGCAQTGTGKTAAFALPMLQRLGRTECRTNGRGRKVRALVLAPTRELSLQIGESFLAYGRFTSMRCAVLHGGVGQTPQVRALNAGVDTLVATPGRLLDLMQQGFVDLAHVEILVLDEADRMLDMGFIHDLRRIVAEVPGRRQTLLFSATLPAAIRQLAGQWLSDPVDVRVGPESHPVDSIRQSVFFVDQAQKSDLLTRWLEETAWTRALVFTRTKHRADRVARLLRQAGIEADAFHANKSQSARQRALARFKSPRPAVLVATDIAARGLDIERVSHVVNYDLPVDAENYVHRIGRTGRAGADGVAVSFCDRGERATLQAIQRLIRQTLAVETHPVGMPSVSSAHVTASNARNRNMDSRGPRRSAIVATNVGRGQMRQPIRNASRTLKLPTSGRIGCAQFGQHSGLPTGRPDHRQDAGLGLVIQGHGAAVKPPAD